MYTGSSSDFPIGGDARQTAVIEDLGDARLTLLSKNPDDIAWAIADAERVLRALPPSDLRDEALAAIEIARRGELRPLEESLRLACFPVLLQGTRRRYPASAFAHLPPVPTPQPKEPPRQHWTDDLADLDDEDLACAGLRREGRFDFFAEDRAEMRAEWMRALGAPNAFKPKADPAPPKLRRQRKPSIRKQIAAAERSGKIVTSITTPDGVTLHFGKGEPSEASNPWLDDLTKTKQ